VQLRYIRLREVTLGRLMELLDRPQDGQGILEYALMLGLIALVVIVVLGVTGKHVTNVFSNVSKDLGNLSTAAAKHKKK
jgi:Flp pilus assembly pilin Flp